MPAYLVANVRVTDTSGYASYRRLVQESLRVHGGKVVARGEGRVLEGGGPPDRTIILEFPDSATLDRWYESDEYRAAKAIRQRTAVSRVIAIEGTDDGPSR